MTCPYCRGRGWAWVGVASNAYREECEPCRGKGRGRVDWGILGGVGLVLLGAIFSLALILWSTDQAFGEGVCEGLGATRINVCHSSHTRTYLVSSSPVLGHPGGSGTPSVLEPSYAEDRTLAWFRTLPEHTKVALVAGAMAATGHVGLRCPEPMSVGEYVARLSWGSSAEADKPWISVYFDLVTARGCQVEEEATTNEEDMS